MKIKEIDFSPEKVWILGSDVTCREEVEIFKCQQNNDFFYYRQQRKKEGFGLENTFLSSFLQLWQLQICHIVHQRTL